MSDLIGTLPEICVRLQEMRCTNLWRLKLWEKSTVVPIDLDWAERVHAAQMKLRPGTYHLRDRYIYFNPNNAPDSLIRLYYAA